MKVSYVLKGITAMIQSNMTAMLFSLPERCGAHKVGRNIIATVIKYFNFLEKSTDNIPQ